MDTLERLSKLLPDSVAGGLATAPAEITEVRLRANRPAQIVRQGGEALVGEAIAPDPLRQIVSALMDHSFYARELELREGFFTMEDGSRVGVCGRFAGGAAEARLTNIGSACVRIARAHPGCADALVRQIRTESGLKSTLILSPPGYGKTTLLRDAARQLSEAGFRVGIADERHELAACHLGVPALDIGPRSDVVDGCAKPQAIRWMIRAMAPDVVIADEIGSEADAEALADAARCGVAVIASAHAEGQGAALKRPWVRSVLDGGAIGAIAVLGGRPGRIQSLRIMGEASAWKPA